MLTEEELMNLQHYADKIISSADKEVMESQKEDFLDDLDEYMDESKGKEEIMIIGKDVVRMLRNYKEAAKKQEHKDLFDELIGEVEDLYERKV